MRQTESKIIHMLKENTGRHMLDSGGAYGRHWEQNQNIDFNKNPTATVDFSAGDIDFTIDLYHFLTDRLEYAFSMDMWFNRFCHKQENDDLSWFECAEKFVEYLETKGATLMYSENSYNRESSLSQVIQYTVFEYDSDEYVMLSIHNGCDVRGGYTKPVIFTSNGNSGPEIYLCEQGTIQCENGHYWDTDDGCHWYYEGCAGYSAGIQLQDYEFLELNETPESKVYRQRNFNGDDQINIVEYEHSGKVAIVDGNGYCSICGGKLTAYI
jgi:hypothetical protein